MTDDINIRLQQLENEVKELKLKSKKDLEDSVPQEPPKKVKKERKPREPTEYNRFMSSYIAEQKEKQGEKFNHKACFLDAAKEWKKTKESKKESA
jgi:hypothetical protein